MADIIKNSMFFGLFISISSYQLGILLQKKYKTPLCNPLLISIVLVIAVLLLTGTSYDDYYSSAKYLNYMLTPATVSLAVPLYRRLKVLKKSPVAILLGVASGVITSLVSVYVFALIFNFDQQIYVTLLPKSVTTAIGLDLSAEMGGIGSITAIAIVITGVFGNIMADSILKLFRVTHPVAMGIAIGCASHAGGTAHAIEIGEVQGAMSSLAIATAGLMTVVLAPIFAVLPL